MKMEQYKKSNIHLNKIHFHNSGCTMGIPPSFPSVLWSSSGGDIITTVGEGVGGGVRGGIYGTMPGSAWTVRL